MFIIYDYSDDENKDETFSTPGQSFTIESEADFPALSSFHAEAYDTNQQQYESDANEKLPLVVFLKKKIKKRKDRNLQ